MFYEINALTNLAIFTGKHLFWRLFLINFIKNRLQHRCFPVSIAKYSSTAFYIEYICEYEFFEYYAMLSIFFRSFLQDMPKNNLTKKQIEAKITKRH